MSHATKTNHTDRLPCSYWISPCCCHRGARLSTVYVFNNRVVFEFNVWRKPRKIRKSRKWFTVSGRSKQASNQGNIHTHGCNEVTLVWGSHKLAPNNYSYNRTSLIVCCAVLYCKWYVLITHKAKAPSLWAVKNRDKHFEADFYQIWIILLSKTNVVDDQGNYFNL